MEPVGFDAPSDHLSTEFLMKHIHSGAGGPWVAIFDHSSDALDAANNFLLIVAHWRRIVGRSKRASLLWQVKVKQRSKLGSVQRPCFSWRVVHIRCTSWPTRRECIISEVTLGMLAFGFWQLRGEVRSINSWLPTWQGVKHLLFVFDSWRTRCEALDFGFLQARMRCMDHWFTSSGSWGGWGARCEALVLGRWRVTWQIVKH